MFKYLLFIIVGILVFILYNYNYINNFTVSARNLSGKARRKYRNKECSATEDLEIDFSTYFTNKKIPIYFIKDEANKIEEDIMKLVTFLVQNRLLRNVQLGSSGPRANIRINPMGLPRTGGKLTPNIGTWGMPHEIIHMPPAEQLVAPITNDNTIISSPIFVHSKDVPIPTTRMTQNGPTIIMAQNKYTIDSYKNGFTELTLSPNDADNATLLAKLGTYYDNFLKNEHFLKGLKNLIEVYETTTYDKIINNEIPIYISLVWKTTPLGGLRGRSGGYHTDGIDDIWNLGAGDTGFDDGLDNDMDKILYNFTIILVPRQKFTYMNIQQKNKGGPRPETLKEPESNSTSVNVIYNKYINDYCYNWNQKLDTQFTTVNLPNWLGSYPSPLLDDVMYSQDTRRNIRPHGRQIFFQRDGRMRHDIPHWNAATAATTTIIIHREAQGFGMEIDEDGTITGFAGADTPAELAGVPLGSRITGVENSPVTTREEILTILGTTRNTDVVFDFAQSSVTPPQSGAAAPALDAAPPSPLYVGSSPYTLSFFTSSHEGKPAGCFFRPLSSVRL